VQIFTYKLLPTTLGAKNHSKNQKLHNFDYVDILLLFLLVELVEFAAKAGELHKRRQSCGSYYMRRQNGNCCKQNMGHKMFYEYVEAAGCFSVFLKSVHGYYQSKWSGLVFGLVS